MVYNCQVNLNSYYYDSLSYGCGDFGVQAGGAGASHNACLHVDSLSFDDAILLLTVFEMLR